MARTEPRDAFFGFFMFFLLLLGPASFLYRDPQAADDPAARGSEESRASLPRVCGESSWSAGNAFYTVAALCFGYYAYPRGSLIAASSGRTWRLSPILVLQELILWIYLLVSAWRKGRTVVIASHAILACRLRSGFGPSTIVQDLDLTVSRRPREVNHEVYTIFKELEAECPKLQVGRTTNLEVGRIQDAAASHPTMVTLPVTSDQADCATSPNVAEPGPVEECRQRLSELAHQGCEREFDHYRHAQRYVSDLHQEFDIEVFTQLIKRLREIDSGPSYRLFVWAPMLLQIAKLVLVAFYSDRISWMVYTVASIYFSAWLTLEVAMLQVSQHVLSSEESETALELCLDWRATLLQISFEDDFDKSMFDELPTAFFVPSLFIAVTTNIVFSAKFVWDSGLPKFENFALAYFVTFWILVGAIIFVSLCTKPIPLLLIDHLFRGLWHLARAEKLFGKLQAPADEDLACFYSASIALHSAVLAIIALVGVGGWKDSFHCWEMSKPRIYDWLG